MIATVVEAVFSSQVLRKSCNTREAPFDHLRFAQRTASDRDDVCHLSGFGFEVTFVLPHHSLRQRKDDALQIEQVNDGVVVLKTVHSPYRSMWKRLLASDGRMQDGSQFRDHSLSKLRIERRLAFGRHFFQIEHVNQRTNQLRIVVQIAAFQLQQIKVALQFVSVRTVTLRTVFLHGRCDDRYKRVGIC